MIIFSVRCLGICMEVAYYFILKNGPSFLNSHQARQFPCLPLLPSPRLLLLNKLMLLVYLTTTSGCLWVKSITPLISFAPRIQKRRSLGRKKLKFIRFRVGKILGLHFRLCFSPNRVGLQCCYAKMNYAHQVQIFLL